MSNPFPRIYENHACPLEGYEGITVRVLVNPVGSVKDDYVFGHFGLTDCPDCAQAGGYCPACNQGRARFGRFLHEAYGETRASGMDFSTPEAALATLDGNTLPDELVVWLMAFAPALWAERKANVKKKLPGYSAPGT